MPVEIVWSRLGREDLLDLYVAIGLESPAAAERIYDRIEEKVGLLAAHPRLGVRRPDIRLSTRMLVAAPYLILYETAPDTDDGPVSAVEIVRIVDGRRDLKGLLGG